MIKKANFKLKVKQKEIIEKKINTEFIKLDAYLKLCDVAQTGGHTKIIIQEGDVKVNGETCFQRGKKLHSGDEVEVFGKIYRLI